MNLADLIQRAMSSQALLDAGVKGAKVINPMLSAYQFSQTPGGQYIIKAGKQAGKIGMAHLQAPSSNLPSHYTAGPGGSRGAYRANKGMKLMKKGGDMYMGGGKMYDEMPDGGKMYEDGGEMKEYMGGGSMEYGHGGEMPNVVIKLAKEGMRMPKEQRAMLANMLMRD